MARDHLDTGSPHNKLEDQLGLPDFIHRLLMRGKYRAGNTTESSPTSPSFQIGLRAAPAVCNDMGVSLVTLWRLDKLGLIHLINILGRNYVDLQSWTDFDRRARAGEFARKPAGAAAKAVKIRAAKLANVSSGNTGEEVE